jgi:hypothetical protein
MPIIAECPFCHVRLRVPRRTTGWSLPCPRCGDSFTLAAMSNPPADTAAVRVAPVLSAAVREAIRAQNGQAHTSEDNEPDEGTVLPEKPARPRPAWIDPLGLAACSCASTGLLAASLVSLARYTIPLCIVGLALGLLGLTLLGVGRSRARLLWSAGGATLNLATLIVALFSPDLFGNPLYWEMGDKPVPAKPSGPIAVGRNTKPGTIAADDWVDANGNAIRQGDVQVRLLAVRGKEVDFKKPPPAPAKPGEPDRGLVILVQVINTGTLRTFDYTSWNTDSSAHTGKLAILKDQIGNAYPQRTFPAGVEVLGQLKKASMPSGRRIEDVLVFEEPPTNIKYLDLELSGSAVGTKAFRFRIPLSMITWSERKQ